MKAEKSLDQLYGSPSRILREKGSDEKKNHMKFDTVETKLGPFRTQHLFKRRGGDPSLYPEEKGAHDLNLCIRFDKI